MDTNKQRESDAALAGTMGVDPALLGKRIVLYVDETMLTERGYRPVMVVEGEVGFREQGDPDKLQEPWYFGYDFATAKRLVDEANERLGISRQDALDIVAASFRG